MKKENDCTCLLIDFLPILSLYLQHPITVLILIKKYVSGDASQLSDAISESLNDMGVKKSFLL